MRKFCDEFGLELHIIFLNWFEISSIGCEFKCESLKCKLFLSVMS